MVDGVAGEAAVVGVGDLTGLPKPLTDFSRNRQIPVEEKPRLELGRRSERKPELPDVPADPPLCRPAVLQRLDVEEDADRVCAQAERFVAVTIATVSTAGSSSAIGPFVFVHELASRRCTSVTFVGSQPSRRSSSPGWS